MKYLHIKKKEKNWNYLQESQFFRSDPFAQFISCFMQNMYWNGNNYKCIYSTGPLLFGMQFRKAEVLIYWGNSGGNVWISLTKTKLRELTYHHWS